MAGPPFLRHPLGEFPKVCAVNLLCTAEDRFKRLPSSDTLIHEIVAVHTSQGRIGKVPLRAIEAIALVNERRAVLPRPGWLGEYSLAPICVASPLVQNQHTSKILQVAGSLLYE